LPARSSSQRFLSASYCAFVCSRSLL
jgi:hypothetical protein